MNEKQKEEVNFWNNLYKRIEDYASFRIKDGENKLKHFKIRKTGLGLDVGCGLVSIFENTGRKVWAIDPLVSFYKDILGNYKHDKNIKYLNRSGEKIGEVKKFDWIACINVLDHTPNPKKMLSEIHTALKDKGSFFFQVNWDESLSPCHYSLFDMDKTNLMLHEAGFQVLEVAIDDNNKDNQRIFNALCQKYQS